MTTLTDTEAKPITFKADATISLVGGSGRSKIFAAKLGAWAGDGGSKTAALADLKAKIDRALACPDVGEVMSVGVADGHAWVLACGPDGVYRMSAFHLPLEGRTGGHYFTREAGTTRDEAYRNFRTRVADLAKDDAPPPAPDPVLAAVSDEAGRALALFLGVRPERVPALLPELARTLWGETVADLAELLADRELCPDRLDGVSMLTRNHPAETIRAAITFVQVYGSADDHGGENTRGDFIDKAKARRDALIDLLEVTGIPTGQRDAVYSALEVLADEEDADVEKGFAGIDRLTEARDKALERRNVLIDVLKSQGIPDDQRPEIDRALTLLEHEEESEGSVDLDELAEEAAEEEDEQPQDSGDLGYARDLAAHRALILARLVAAVPGYGDLIPPDLRAEIDAALVLADFERPVDVGPSPEDIG